MPKPRVYELARELGLSSQEIIEKLKAMGIEAKAPSSSVDEDQATKFKRHVRLESQGSKKSRVYGSEEDEGERDALEKERAARVAAERAEREVAASEAEKERSARKAGGRPKAAATAPPAAAVPAVRLAPRVAAKPVEPAPEPTPIEKPTAAKAAPAPATSPAPGKTEAQKGPMTVAPIGRARRTASSGSGSDSLTAVDTARSQDGSLEGATTALRAHELRPDAEPVLGLSDDVAEGGVPAVGPSAAPVRMTPRIAPLRPIGRPAHYIMRGLPVFEFVFVQRFSKLLPRF